MLPRPSIAVVGAGALGLYYGARLAQHGTRVHFLARSDFEQIREHGITVESHDGDFELSPDQVSVFNNSADIPPVDLVLVTLKTTANDQFEALIRPLLGAQTQILTLQNGLGNEQRLAELFGAERILGGMAFVCINRLAPGQVAHTDHGFIRIGEFQTTGITPRLTALSDLFSASQIPCKPLTDLIQGRWEKLMWNIPFNGLGTAMLLTTDRLIATAAGRHLVRDLIDEAAQISEAEGHPIPEAFRELQITRTASMGAYKTSMQVDREQGRPLEIEAILGNALLLADWHRLAVPNLRALDAMLRALDEPPIA